MQLCREKILIPKTKNHITMIGITDNDETVIAWNSTASDVIYGGQKLQTINSATVAVEADYFIARNITFMVNMLSCILHFILSSNYYRSNGERERERENNCHS